MTKVELIELAKSGNWGKRYIATSFRDMPEEILFELAEDEKSIVRWGLAWSGNISVGLSTKLAEDEAWEVRGALANNPNTPSEIFLKLAGDKDKRVRYLVAYSPLTPNDILAKLAEDEDKEVGGCAMENIRIRRIGTDLEL